MYAHSQRVRTRVRIKRNVTGPLRGPVYQPRRGWYKEPGSRRLTVRYEKEKRPLTNPEGVGTGPLRGPVT